MKGRVLALQVVWVVALSWNEAVASEEWPVQVYQPVHVENGTTVSAVTYVTFEAAPAAVELTCSPNRVLRLDGWRGGVVPEGTEENAAFASGLRIELDGMRGWPWRSGSDTIYVDLDVFALAAPTDSTGWSDSVLVAATVEAVKANAGSYAGAVRWLRLEIRGPRAYRGYGGTFALADYSHGPRKLYFP